MAIAVLVLKRWIILLKQSISFLLTASAIQAVFYFPQTFEVAVFFLVI